MVWGRGDACAETGLGVGIGVEVEVGTAGGGGVSKADAVKERGVCGWVIDEYELAWLLVERRYVCMHTCM